MNLEGMGGGTGDAARGPRVVAVIAGGERAYSMEPPRDDIRYFVMGPTSAMPRLGEDSTVAVRGVMLLKLEPEAGKESPGGGVHAALLRLGGGGGGGEGEPIVPEEAVQAQERHVIDTIATWGDDIIGVDGLIDQRGGAEAAKSDLHVRMKNPLADPIDLTIHASSARAMGGAGDPRREVANMLVEGFDLPWELSTRHILRHLEAKGRAMAGRSILRGRRIMSRGPAMRRRRWSFCCIGRMGAGRGTRCC